MLIKKVRPAMELFDSLDMKELSQLITKANADNFLIIAGIVESYLNIDILDYSGIDKITTKEKEAIKKRWDNNSGIIKDAIFKKIGQTVAGETVFERGDKRFFYALTAGLITIALLYLIGVTFVPLGDHNQRIADTVTGFMMGSILSPIIGYFYISTSSNLKIKAGANSGESPDSKG